MLKRLENPIFQMAMLLGVLILMHLVVALVMLGAEVGHHYHWVLSAAFLLLYSFFVAIFLLKTDRMGWLIRQAIYGFLGMLAGSYGLAFAFSDEGINMRSIKWIYFIVSFSFIIFLIIAYSMRKVLEYAQRQDNVKN